MTTKVDLLSLLPTELEEYFVSIGEPKFRAKQVFTRLHKGERIGEITNLSKALREKLVAETLDTLPTVEEKLVSKIDGTVKYLFRLHDGACIESVFMRYKHGNTLCISSQVGCRMGCKFCASTIGGRVRDLTPAELVGQVIAAQKDISVSDPSARIGGIVMMGIGEPLDNYEQVVRFLRMLGEEGGVHIGMRHISLSTCGLVPGIYRLMEEQIPLTLSISLHAPNDEIRSQSMPVNKRWPIEELLSACRDYIKATGRRISFEYAMIDGVNDTPEAARELIRLLKGLPAHMNLRELISLFAVWLESEIYFLSAAIILFWGFCSK